MEFTWIRNWCNLVFSVVMLVQKRITPLHGITRQMWLPLALRCGLGNIGFILITYSFKVLPLSIGTVIIACSPFAVAVMSSVVLNESISNIDVIAIIVSFAGIVILSFGGEQGGANQASAKEYI